MNKEEFYNKLEEIDKVHILKKQIHNLNIQRIVQNLIRMSNKYKNEKETNI